jgi:hypothetical protein
MPAEPRTPTPLAAETDPALDGRLLLAGGVFLFLAGAACGAMLYAFGLAGRQFDMTVLRGGLLTFGIVTLAVATGAFLLTVIVHLLALLWPRSLSVWSERLSLRRLRRKATGLLETRRTQQEERARLTARMQATYLLEKESAQLANQQALKELRTALQGAAVRSCEVVYEHLNRTLGQYTELVREIETSWLPAAARRELMGQLSRKLTEDVRSDKARSAQAVMESAIWDVRLSKAREMAQHRVSSAVAYLQKIRQRTDSHRILLQIDALIRELSAPA